MSSAPRASANRSYEALEERVANQGASIRALAEETATQFRDFRADTSKAISELASSIKGIDTKLEGSVGQLASKLDSQATRQAEASRPQYLSLFGAMVAAVGVAIGIIQWQQGLHDKPVDDKLTALTTSIADLAKTTTAGFTEVGRSTVSQSEWRMTNDYLQRIGEVRTQGRDVVRARIQSDLDLLRTQEQSDFGRIQNEIVPRQEHQFHWDAEAKIDTHLEDEIRALTGRVDNLAPAGDLLRTLSEREHEHDLELARLQAEIAKYQNGVR